jgi:hypothetical protein
LGLDLSSNFLHYHTGQITCQSAFFAASILRAKGAKGSIQSGISPVHVSDRNASLHHFISHPAKKERIGQVEVLDRVTMQLFVREYWPMI